MSRRSIIVRVMAEVPDEAAAATVGNGLLAGLWTLGILWLEPPVRYWKVPEWFEVALRLTPKDGIDADRVLAALGEGWRTGGDADDRWADWNPAEGASFFDPRVRWANVESVPPGDARLVGVSVTGPEHGWLRLRVATSDGVVVVPVSYTPNDFVRDLLTALSLAADRGEGVAVANAEPDTFEFRLVGGSAGNPVRLSVVERRRGTEAGTVVASAAGTLETVVMPFVAALRSIEQRTGPDGYRTGMRREFPSAKLRHLLERLRSPN